MRHFPALIGILVLLLTSCNPYREFDSMIRYNDSFKSTFEWQTDSLKSKIGTGTTDERWNINRQIFDNYIHYQLDSCYRYVDSMLCMSGNDKQKKIISQTSLVKLYYRKSFLTDAQKVFESIDTSDIGDEALISYYSIGTRLYNRMSLYSIKNAEYKEKGRSLAAMLWKKDSMNIQSITARISYLIVDKKFDEAINILSKCKETIRTDEEKTMIYYLIGNTYILCNEKEKAIPFLRESAVIDIKLSIMNNTSLFLLAELLYENKDYLRASDYLELTIKNNRFCGYKELVGRDYNLDYLLSPEIRRQNRIKIILFLCLISTSVIFLTILVVLIIKLKSLNVRLKQASENKNKLIAKYVELSADYIYGIDKYKSKLRKTAREHGADAVMSLIRTSPHADSEFTNFKKTFDEFYLWMYPSFVDDVNEMMMDGHKIEKPKARLNTGLRILALICLGISDRQKISKILNISIQSVYTYHSLLKADSKYSSDLFDLKVAELGQI